MANWWDQAPLVEQPASDNPKWWEAAPLATQAPAPKEKPGFIDRLGDAANSMLDPLRAAAQLTSPIIKDIQGNPNYESLGPVLKMDFGDAYKDQQGQYQRVDPTRHVVLRDPSSNQMTVFARNQKMEENPLTSLGRVIPFGAMVQPPTRIPSLPQGNPAYEAAKQAAGDFAIAKVPPTAGAITGNRGIQAAEKGLEYTPGGAHTMQSRAKAQVDAAGEFADDLAQRYATGGGANPTGQVVSEQTAGGVMKEGAKQADSRFKARQGQLYDQAFERIGADTRVPLQGSSVASLADELNAGLAKAPESLQGTYGAALDRIKKLVADAADGTVSFEALRKVRTSLGKSLEKPMLGGVSAESEPSLRQLYGALTDDMARAAESVGPEAAKLLQLADRYTRFNMNQNMPLLQKIVDAGTDEAAFNFATNMAKDGGSRLYALRRNMKPEEWDTVAGTVVAKLGEATPGKAGAVAMGEQAPFSVNTFLTNWNRLSDEAKYALFAGTRYAELKPELDRLVRITGRLQDAEKMSNPSGTAKNLVGAGTIGSAFTALSTGHPLLAASTVLSTTVAPWAGAQLMTSPKFVNWLSGLSTVSEKPAALASHWAKLEALGQQEPQMVAALREFAAASRPRIPLPSAADEEKHSVPIR